MTTHHSTQRQKIVFVGNGMSTIRALQEIVALGSEGLEITVFGDEPQPAYDRIQLPSVLAGERDDSAILLAEPDWYNRHGIHLRRGTRIAKIDRVARRVITTEGHAESYDKLVLATGSRPIHPPLPGTTLDNVITFRTLGDVAIMREAAAGGGSAVVIGGGLLGLEAASALHRLGMSVCVLHLMEHLMERQLDSEAGGMLRREIEQKGIRVMTGVSATAIEGERQAEAVCLADGRRLPADLVIFAIGIRPDVTLAGAANLATGRGILVDDRLTTSDPAIHALGECVEHRGTCYGLVAPLYDMASVLAQHLTGRGQPLYTGSPLSTQLKVSGVNLFSAGSIEADTKDDLILSRDPIRGRYRKIVLREGRVTGAILFGDTADAAFYARLHGKAAGSRALLPFGAEYADMAALDPYGGQCSLAG